MGLDLSQMFGNAQAAAEQGMTDLLKIGGNAALGYLEKEAISAISADQQRHEGLAKAATMDVISRPGAASAWGNYLQDTLQSPILKNYGPYIIGAVVVVAIGAIALSRR